MNGITLKIAKFFLPNLFKFKFNQNGLKNKSFTVVNIIMAYLGREIWLFLTEEGRPGALYSVSGRSPASRQREAVYYPEEKRISIEPLDKLEKADPLRHYNAMKFRDDLLVVSNGLHTEDIFNSPYRESLRTILNKWGPEPDKYSTPRIAGIVNNSLFSLAIIVPKTQAEVVELELDIGMAYGISTYSGKEIEPEPFEIDKLIKRQLSKSKIEGKTPKSITDFFTSKVIDQEFFVCCSTAILYEELGEWEVFILNKNG